jgi:hypothetical protein
MLDVRMLMGRGEVVEVCGWLCMLWQCNTRDQAVMWADDYWVHLSRAGASSSSKVSRLAGAGSFAPGVAIAV